MDAIQKETKIRNRANHTLLDRLFFNPNTASNTKSIAIGMVDKINAITPT